MYDVEGLEKKWKRYRRKRLLYSASLVLLLLLLVLFITYFLSLESEKDIQSITTVKATLDNSNSIKKKKNAKIHNLAVEVPSLKPENKIQVGKIIFNNSEVPIQKKKKNLLIQITERSKGALPKDIERRFSYRKEKSDALFLAKYYYDKNLFKEAEKWALETNKIDSKLEESWLIFAKAKAKMGQRIEALKILQTYYNESQSIKARKLIDNIRRGHDF